MTKTVPVKDLRRDLGPLLDEVSDRREHIVVTRHGRPAAVIIPHDEYTALEETADVLADPGAMAALAEWLRSSSPSRPPMLFGLSRRRWTKRRSMR